MNTLQQPKPQKVQPEGIQNRTVTESAPLNNASFLQSQLAQNNVIQQSLIKNKKLNLGASKFDSTTVPVVATTQIQPPQQQQQIQYQQQQQFQQQEYYPQQQQQYNNQYPQQQQYNQYAPQQQYQQQQYNNYPTQYPQQQQQQQYQNNQYINNIPPPQQAVITPEVPRRMSLKKKLQSTATPLNLTPLVSTPSNPSEVMNDLALKVEDPKKKEQLLKKQLEQEEADLKAKEAQLKLDILKAQPRSLKQILEIQSKETFSGINSKILALSGREVKSTKTMPNFSRNSNNNRNQQGSYNNKPQYNNKPAGRDSIVKKPVEDLHRGSNVVPSEIVSDKDSLQIRRYVEDPSVKLKKEELKKNLRWLEMQDQTDEQKKLQKDLKFKLNQLAPDNKDIITKAIIDIIVVENQLAENCAGQIMEKAWLEPRYRELYTEVCKVIVNDPRLQQDITDSEGKIKKRQIFKDAILNKVQTAFESDDILKKSEEELQKLSKHELEIQYIRRKNRILGNVRFIGDLFIQGVLPEQAIYGAQTSLLSKFLHLSQSDRPNSVLQFNPEDQLEGLVELYDKAGEALEKSQEKKTKKKITPAAEAQAIDAVAKALQAKQFEDVQLEINFTVNGMFKLLHVLDKYLHLSKRINILIENLEDRKNNKWAQHYNHKNESAKTLDALQKEQDDLQDKQYEDDRKYRDRERGGGGGSRYNEKKSQNNQYQPKQQSKESYYEKDQYQSQSYQEVPKKAEKEIQKGGYQPAQDAKDVERSVRNSFELPMEEQLNLLEECFNDIKNEPNLQYAFWEQFFFIILEAKQKNVSRADLFYQIVKDRKIDYNSFIDGLQKKFKDDNYIYDLVDSKLGIDLYVELWSPFFGHNESDFLEDYFKPDVGIEGSEWKTFLQDVGKKILKNNGVPFHH